MARRSFLVVAGALVTALLAVGAYFYPLPFVVLDAGPTVDTLGRHEGRQVITVTGGKVSSSAGQLRLTTVQVDTEVGLWDAVGSWFDGDQALVPRSVVYPADLSDQQVERLNAEQFASSERSAEAVARRELGSGTPFTVAFGVEDIGGPSAGLMFTLGLIDKLTPADLTGGRIIAGTGTIDQAGAVGPISGIPQKLVGAEAAGAQLFLVPVDNCAEAVANAVPGLPMAKVATVDEALTALQAFTAGKSPTGC